MTPDCRSKAINTLTAGEELGRPSVRKDARTPEADGGLNPAVHSTGAPCYAVLR